MARSLNASEYLDELQGRERKRWVDSGDYDRQMANDKVLKKFVDIFDTLLASTHWVEPLAEGAPKDDVDDWTAAREAVAGMRTRVRADRLLNTEGFSFSDKIHFARKLAKKILGDMYRFGFGRDVYDWTPTWKLSLMDATTFKEMQQMYTDLDAAMRLSNDLDKTPSD